MGLGLSKIKREREFKKAKHQDRGRKKKNERMDAEKLRGEIWERK